MIQVVKPKIGERIYDGALGSAGSLCEAYDYLRHGDLITSQLQGSVGFGPNAASSGNLALSPQAARNNAIDPATKAFAVRFTPNRQPLACAANFSPSGPPSVTVGPLRVSSRGTAEGASQAYIAS
jgi:hypothetical protein